MRRLTAIELILLTVSLRLLMAQERQSDNFAISQSYTIPIIDLDGQTHRQVIVDKEVGQYLGHPSMVLLEDGRTMLIVYPKGHGKGEIILKRSSDGGLTWSNRMPTPKSWTTSQETPTLYRVVDAKGVKRLLVFSGLYPIRMSVSTDDGGTWTELEPIGDYGGIVAMSSMVALRGYPGRYMALFHDDGRFIGKNASKNPEGFRVYKTISEDGGLTWGQPEMIASHPQAHLCEPGIIRSSGGGQLAVLLRENSRKFNSFVIFSEDDGKKWSQPRELPGSLTGDRHVGCYALDGRLFITFRDANSKSKTEGDWVRWVGRYEDIVDGSEGEFRVRVMKNYSGWDCAYPGLELLPGGTFVTATYGHWIQGEEPYIVSVRFAMEELDALAKELLHKE
jgi:hypothetical protein